MNKHFENLSTAAQHMSAILSTASGATCSHQIMTGEYIAALPFPQLVHDNHGNPLHPGDSYMVITCKNGYKYYVNITGDSVITACAETLSFASGKL